MFYRRFFPLSFLLSWEHNWSVLFSSFVLGFRRNMGSVPRGCNSRCFCVRGICGSAAQNPQDKDSRYGKETRNPEKKLKPFKFNIRWHKKQEGRLNCKKKRKKRLCPKKANATSTRQSTYCTPPAVFRCHVFYLHPPVQSERNEDRLINLGMAMWTLPNRVRPGPK